MTAALDRELLARIGTVLYGEHWQAPMARALGKSKHTVSRWATGSTSLPRRWVWERLLSEVTNKKVEVSQLAYELPDLVRNRNTESGGQIFQGEDT